MHYLDTSVLASYYCPEARSSAIQALLAHIDGPTISPLVEVELHCAVARKIRAGELDAPAGRVIFAQFRAHIAQPRFHVIAVREAHYQQARDWIAKLETPLRVLDALHLAVAHAHGLRLVTADRDLSGSARHFGVRCTLVS